MNIHCVDTFTILLLVVSLATAQHSWDSVFGFHRQINYDIPTYIEVPHPRIVRIFDDDYRESLRRLHLFEPFEPPQPVIPAPVVYLPMVHIAPEVYVDELNPFVYNNRFHDPFSPPYLNRLQTTVSVSYRARVLRVVDKDENEEAQSDSLTSDTNTVPQAVTTTADDPKATSKITPKKDGKGRTTSSTPQSSDKKVTPKPNTKVETVKNTDAKPDDGKTTESTTKLETTKNKAVDGVQSEPVEKEDEAASDSTTPADSSNDENAEPAATENTDGSTTDSTDVPTE